MLDHAWIERRSRSLASSGRLPECSVASSNLNAASLPPRVSGAVHRAFDKHPRPPPDELVGTDWLLQFS
jgi:hypothetical protein